MGADSSPTRARRPDGARSPATLAAAVLALGPITGDSVNRSASGGEGCTATPGHPSVGRRDRRWPGVPVREPQTGFGAGGGPGVETEPAHPRRPALGWLCRPGSDGAAATSLQPPAAQGSCERWQRSARGGVARLVSPAAPAAAPSQGRGAKGVTGSRGVRGVQAVQPARGRTHVLHCRWPPPFRGELSRPNGRKW